MAVKKTYRINLRNYGSPPAVMVSQYDEGYAIAFEIFDGPLPVLASSLSGYTFKLKGRQPGNPPFLAYEFEGTLATALNAVVSFEIDTTMTGRAGKGTAELVILDEENDVKFASVNFAVYTEPAAVPDGSIDADVQRAMEIAEEVQEIVDTAAETVSQEAEAWAVGQRGGQDVPSTDPAYQNNAKYYAQQAAETVEEISDVTDQVATNTSDISDLKEDLNAKISTVNGIAPDENGNVNVSASGGGSGVYDESLLFAGNSKVITDYYNNTEFKVVCKIPANKHITRVEVMGNSSATSDNVPVLQVLRDDGDNVYTVLYSKTLTALSAGVYTSTDVDFEYAFDTYIAIGGCKNICNVNASSYALSKAYTHYANAGTVGGTVTAAVVTTYKLYYSVNVYSQGADLTPSAVETVEGYDYFTQSIEICPDETVYDNRQLALTTKIFWSPRFIPAGKKIAKVRVKAYEAGTITIAFADFSQQPTISRWLVMKVLTAPVVAGWNTIDINLTFDRAVSLGYSGITTPCFDYRDINKQSVYAGYKFGTGNSSHFSSDVSGCTEGNWTSGQHTDSSYYIAVPITWYLQEGELYNVEESIAELENAVKLIPNNADLRTVPVIPNYTILKDADVGYVGKWYTKEIDGQIGHVCNAAGAEFYFRTQDTNTVTINFGMASQYLDTSYYAYNIDGGDFTRVSASSPTITLPDDNWHIVRVVCDSIASGMTYWSDGGGFVVFGVNAGNGSAVGLLPDKTKRIVHLGDSIAVGCRAFGTEVSGESVESDVTSVTHSYSWYCSEALNAISYMDSYGGTGVTNGGSSANCATMIEYAAPNILAEPIDADLVVLEHGHNDSSASAANFETAYKALLQKIRCAYPAAPIVCVVPFNLQKKSVIESVVPTEDNCYLVNVYFDLYPPTYYADGPGHLLAAGAELVGKAIAKHVREMHLL